MTIARLIYVSKAASGVDDIEIGRILSTARRVNAEKGVTGLLLHAGTHFLQMLEGPENAVGEVFDRIREDSRHSDVLVLSTERGAERQFPDWTMGFERYESEDLPEGKGWFELAKPSLDERLPESVSSDVRLLFTSFYALNRRNVAAE